MRYIHWPYIIVGSVDLTHYVKATDCITTIHPPTIVSSFKPARLYPLTVIEPALLPQFYLCGTSWYCVGAAQLLVMLSFTDTVKPGKLLHQLDGEVSMHCWLLGPAGILYEEHGKIFGLSCVATTWPLLTIILPGLHLACQWPSSSSCWPRSPGRPGMLPPRSIYCASA